MPTARQPGGAPGWRAGLVIAGAAPSAFRSRFVTAMMRPAALPTGAVALVARAPVGETGAMRTHRYPHACPTPRSAFAGYRFPPEVITLAVRWYLRFGLSYRDVEELLSERG